MSDAKTRLAQREGLGLKERLRAGDLVPSYTTAREIRVGTAHDGSGESGAIVLPFEPLDLVRLLAFLGVEEAREIHEGEWGLCGCHESEGWCEHLEDPDDETPLLVYWCAALQRLAAKLPPKRVEAREQCRPCRGTGGVKRKRGIYRCSPCESTGRVSATHDTDAERWLLVVAALAVARECLEVTGDVYGCPQGYDSATGVFEPAGYSQLDCAGCGVSFRGHKHRPLISLALGACQAWVDEPTPEREDTWTTAARTALDEWARPDWLPYRPLFEGMLGLLHALQAAAKILTPDKVREIASAAVLL